MILNLNRKCLRASVISGVLVLCNLPALGQTDSTVTSDGMTTAESPITEMRTFFGEPFKGHWTFTGEGQLGQEYDDNVFALSSLRLSDTVSHFSLRLSAGIRKKRLTFQAHYLPDYLLHAKYSQSNSFSQQYRQDLTYRWSAHTDLGWTASASRIETGSNSPALLVQFAPDSAAPVFYPSALQQNTNITGASSSITLSHRFTARLTMKGDITGSFDRFTSSNGTPLFAGFGDESFQAGGRLGWEYEIVTGKKLGIQLRDSYSGFLNPSSHQSYQAALMTYSQQLPGKFFVSVGAGPSFNTSTAFSSASAVSELSYALNVAVSRTLRTYNLGISLDRGSQLGTFQGSLSTLSSSIHASRAWRRRWTTGASFSYSQMRTLVSSLQTDSYSASGSAGYRLSPDLQFQLRYSYINQLSPVLISQSFDRNLYGLSIVYSFGPHRSQ